MQDVYVCCFLFSFFFFFAYSHSTCLILLSWSGSSLTFPVRVKRSSGYWGDIAKVCTKLLINNREIVASEQQGFFQKFSKWNISDCSFWNASKRILRMQFYTALLFFFFWPILLIYSICASMNQRCGCFLNWMNEKMNEITQMFCCIIC